MEKPHKCGADLAVSENPSHPLSSQNRFSICQRFKLRTPFLLSLLKTDFQFVRDSNSEPISSSLFSKQIFNLSEIQTQQNVKASGQSHFSHSISILCVCETSSFFLQNTRNISCLLHFPSLRPNSSAIPSKDLKL